MKKLFNRVTALCAAISMLASLACINVSAAESEEKYHDNVTINGIDMYEYDSFFGEGDGKSNFGAYWTTKVIKDGKTDAEDMGFGGISEKFDTTNTKFGGNSIKFHFHNKADNHKGNGYTVDHTSWVQFYPKNDDNKNGIDISGILDHGYLRFWMYVDTTSSLEAEKTMDHSFSVIFNGTAQHYFTVKADELDKWIVKEFKLSDFYSGASSKVAQKFTLFANSSNLTTGYDVSFQNVGFYYPELLKKTDNHELKYMLYSNTGSLNKDIVTKGGQQILQSGDDRWGDASITKEKTLLGGSSLNFYSKSEYKQNCYMYLKLKQPVDLTAYNDPYLEFYTYIDIDTSKQNVENLPNIYLQNSSGWISSDAVSLKSVAKLNEWCKVQIKLSDLYNDKGFNPAACNVIRFDMKSKQENYNIYVQNIGFYDAHSIKFTTLEQRNNKVALAWNASNASSVENYKVYENDVVVATVTEQSAIIDVTKYDTVNNYKVEALDADGNVISESELKTVAVYKLATEAKEENVIYGTDGQIKGISAQYYTYNWGVPKFEYTDKLTAVDGKSMVFENTEMTVQTTGHSTVQIEFKPDNTNKPGIARKLNENMYMECLIYLDTDNFEKSSMGVWTQGVTGSEWPIVKTRQWNFIKVKLADKGFRGEQDVTALKLELPYTSDGTKYKVYIQNLRYVSDVENVLVLKNGTEITAANGGDTIDVIANNVANAKLLVAEYKGDALVKATICDGLDTEYTIGTDCDSVKAFAWELGTLKPVTVNKTVTVTQTVTAE